MPTLHDVYRAATSRFVQSVVVVDDRAALNPVDDGLPPDDAELIDPRVRHTESEEAEPPSDSDLADERRTEVEAAHEGAAPVNALDAGALIDRFAELGIVCAALRPVPGDTEAEQRVLKAGQRADIVTLDWHLGEGESGARARDLLKMLTEPVGRRLRLVAIYTGDTSVEVLREEVAALSDVETVDDFTFARRSARIVLLFKAGTEEYGAPPSQVTSVTDLPDRLIYEFTKMSAGLVPAAALSSLGAIREATPEILGVLNADLDPAYIGHRLAQTRPDDVSDHLTDLVVSEIRSILEDDHDPAPAADANAVQLWLDHQPDDQVTVERDALAELNVNGAGDGPTLDVIRNKYPLLSSKGKKTYPTRFFVADEAKADLYDARLAERMSTRYRYENARSERLELGVVVKSLTTGDYWVCVQPLCDSVRLKTATSMPMLPLKVGAEKSDFTILIEDKPTHLTVLVKPPLLRTISFEPDEETQSIVASTTADDRRGFTDTEGAIWELVCRLKAEHSQRLAYRIGAAFSRVGLNESEWQRRRSPKDGM